MLPLKKRVRIIGYCNMVIEMRRNVAWVYEPIMGNNTLSEYQSFLAHAAGCFGSAEHRQHEWRRPDRHRKPRMKRLWYPGYRETTVGTVLIAASSRAKKDDGIIQYAHKYLEFVRNSDCSLPLFSSVLRVQLSILKHK